MADETNEAVAVEALGVVTDLPPLPLDHPHAMALGALRDRYDELAQDTRKSEQYWQQVATARRRDMTQLEASYRALLAAHTPPASEAWQTCGRYTRTCAGWRTADALSADLTYAGEARDAWRTYAEHLRGCATCTFDLDGCELGTDLHTEATQADKLIDPGHGVEALPAPATLTLTVYEQRLALRSGADALRISAERAADAGHRGFAASEEAHARILDALCEAMLDRAARSEGGA